MSLDLYTIGHSTHSIEEFLSLLEQHDIDVIVDVRSTPYSRYNPQFNKDTLIKSLRDHGIKYVFLGEELGARSSDPSCYKNGQVQFDALSETELFKSGIDRILLGVQRDYKMALMCAEKDPLDCHRTVLVSRNLERNGLNVTHILSDGSLETHDAAMERLVKQFRLHQNDLFLSEQELTEKAYKKQEEKIAYAEDNSTDQAVG